MTEVPPNDLLLPDSPKPPAAPQCVCVTLPSADGEQRPATWFALHQEIAVQMRSGETRQGVPEGFVRDHRGDLLLCLVPAGEGLRGLPLTEIASVSPLPGATADEAVAQVVEALRCPWNVPPTGFSVDVIVNDHETLEVTVTPYRYRCTPVGH